LSATKIVYYVFVFKFGLTLTVVSWWIDI